jgi:small subunit ribosomal protein S9
MADEKPDMPQDETADGGSEVPAAEGEERSEEERAGEEVAEPQPAADPGESPATEDRAAPEGEAPAAEPEGQAPEERPPRDKREQDKKKEQEVVPGAHLEPDLVLEEQEGEPAEGYPPEYAPGPEYAEEGAPEPEEAPAAEAEGAAEPRPRTPVELAADARYYATGKRKTSVARVILKPGKGTYTVNGRPLDEFFPRVTLQTAARQPLQTVGYESSMDVVATIHGGGVSAQAGALRHGVARALVEADPALRLELKRRGFLSRDARAKERKKAGLKKARKRPQFSKR